MIPLYLEYLLKIKIAEIVGKLPVNTKNNINTIQYKNILLDNKNHYNNLIGKVVLDNFNFYYVPINLIENYENNQIGIPICYHIYICPFCFGIQLDIEEQMKLYKIITLDSEINQLLKDKFCFEIVKNYIK